MTVRIVRVKSLCVFCGSNAGVNPAFAQSTRVFARELVRRDIGIIYGGGNVGLMGVVADAVLEAGGRVTGVIPHGLVVREVAHHHLTELHVVDSMHERKALMASLADGFVALPGGIGTLEEFCEVVTWTQLGIQAKPCGLLNVAGFYDSFLAFFEHAITEGFVRPNHHQVVVADVDPIVLINRMTAWTPPPIAQWLRPGEQ